MISLRSIITHKANTRLITCGYSHVTRGHHHKEKNVNNIVDNFLKKSIAI